MNVKQFQKPLSTLTALDTLLTDSMSECACDMSLSLRYRWIDVFQDFIDNHYIYTLEDYSKNNLHSLPNSDDFV